MQISKLFPVAITAIALVFGGGNIADAKNKKGKKPGKSAVKTVPPGQIQRQANGLKPIPPGQIKRYTRGSKLPGGAIIQPIGDLSKWKLKPLNPGEEYVRIDNDILKINKDTRTVIDAVGIVDDLLK